jgi:hypothetical protein
MQCWPVMNSNAHANTYNIGYLLYCKRTKGEGTFGYSLMGPLREALELAGWSKLKYAFFYPY